MESDPYVQKVILTQLNITFNSFDANALISLITIGILLIFSALISGSEVAFFSLSPEHIEDFKKSDSQKSKTILGQLQHPNQLLATILVSNNFINIGIVILSTYFTNTIIDFSQAPILGFIIQVVIITFLLLLFGEIIPKVYANKFPKRFALFMTLPLWLLDKLFKPISFFLVSSTKVIDKRFQRKQNLSMNDLSDALELTSESIAEDKKILKGIVEFGNLEVSEIMCPRLDVFSIDINTPFSRVVHLIVDAGYSRIPIYDKSFDHINGILYIKDLLPHIQKNDSFRWQSLIRPPYFVPEKKKINELLEELQAKRIHVAIVVDEYGGTSGMITMEDILEEIVGEIADETDEDEINYTKIDENNYIFEGKIQLPDFYKILELESDIFDEIKGDADTLAGIILELKGEFPALYDTIKYKQLTFTIDEIDHRRIKKIKTSL